MKFKTIAEAFNYYRNYSVADLEKRAAEIRGIISTDANADVEAFNVELDGIKQAKENTEQRSAGNTGAQGFNVITGTGTASNGKKSFDVDTVCDTPEYRSAFYKTLLGRSLNETETEAFNVAMKEAEKRADAFNTSSDSSAVLPTETLNEVVRKAHTMGGLLAECRAFNVPTKIAIPVGSAGGAASWHVEGATVETEQAVTASVTFDGYEIIKIFSISAKVRKMSVPAFEAYLTDELTACVMETIADALVNGTGSAQGTGLESGITWTTTGDDANAFELSATDWANWTKFLPGIASLKRGYAAGAKIAMNNYTLYTTFYGMQDSNGAPIFIADPKTDEVGKIFGFPVVVDDHISDDVIYFGNFNKYMGYNLPEGVVIETSRESGFRKGLIDYRALAIADCKPIVGEAFRKIYKAAAQG